MDDDGNGYVDDIHGYNFVDDNAIFGSSPAMGLMVRALYGATNK